MNPVLCCVSEALLFWLLIQHFIASGMLFEFDASHHAVVNLLVLGTILVLSIARTRLLKLHSKVSQFFFQAVLVIWQTRAQISTAKAASRVQKWWSWEVVGMHQFSEGDPGLCCFSDWVTDKIWDMVKGHSEIKWATVEVGLARCHYCSSKLYVSFGAKEPRSLPALQNHNFGTATSWQGSKWFKYKMCSAKKWSCEVVGRDQWLLIQHFIASGMLFEFDASHHAVVTLMGLATSARITTLDFGTATS